MTNLYGRHMDLATLAKTPQERALHLAAANAHRVAHVSAAHAAAARAATAMAFDSRCGGTAMDAGSFEESKHPRADNGQFGSGSGGTSSKASTEHPVGTHVKINSPGVRGHGQSGHILSSRDGHYQVEAPAGEYTNYMVRHENVKPTGKPPKKGSKAEKEMKSRATTTAPATKSAERTMPERHELQAAHHEGLAKSAKSPAEREGHAAAAQSHREAAAAHREAHKSPEHARRAANATGKAVSYNIPGYSGPLLPGRIARDESFEKLEDSLAHKKGVRDPAALAAYIGREHGKIK